MDGKRNEMKLKTNEPDNGKQGINERDKVEPFCIPSVETLLMKRKLERRWKERAKACAEADTNRTTFGNQKENAGKIRNGTRKSRA